MRAVKAIVLFATTKTLLLRTEGGNMHNYRHNRIINKGTEVWVYFNEEGDVTNAVPITDLEPDEIPPDENYDLDDGLWVSL